MIVPHFAPGGGSPFEGRYAASAARPAGIARPARASAARYRRSDRASRPRVPLDLLVPLLGLPLLSPLVAATALPELALNLLSSTRTQTSIHFHYTAGAIPGLVAGAVLGAARVQRRVPRLTPTLCRVAVLVVLARRASSLGPLPAWRHVPFGSKLATRDDVVTAHDARRGAGARALPAGVPVSATNTLGAHLSERRRIFSFPVLREARWVAVDTRQPSYLDARSVGGSRRLRAAAPRPRWRVVRAEDGVVVLHAEPLRDQAGIVCGSR